MEYTEARQSTEKMAEWIKEFYVYGLRTPQIIESTLKEVQAHAAEKGVSGQYTTEQNGPMLVALELVHQLHPEATKQLLQKRPGNVYMRMGAFLCATWPKQYAHLYEDIVEGAMFTTFRIFGYKVPIDTVHQRLAAQPALAAHPKILQRLRRRSKEELRPNLPSNDETTMLGALYLSQGKMPELAAAYNNMYPLCVGLMYRLWYPLENYEGYDEVLIERLAAFAEQVGLDKELLVYCVAWNAREGLDDLFYLEKRYPGVLHQTALGIFQKNLYTAIYQLGPDAEVLAKNEQLLLEELCEKCETEEDKQAVANWLQHDLPLDEAEKLPDIYLNAHEAYPLYGLSPMGTRMAKYALVRYPSALTHFINHAILQNSLNYSEAMQQLHDMGISDADIIRYGAGHFEKYWGNEIAHAYMLALEREVAAQKPALLAQALCARPNGDEGQIRLMNLLYANHPKYDPTPLLGKMGDKSKKVRAAALQYLKPHSQLLEAMREKQTAKQAPVREMAGVLVRLWEGERLLSKPNPDAAKVAAFCKQSLNEKAAAAIAWLQPGGWPAIHWAKGGKADKVVPQYLVYLFISEGSGAFSPVSKGLRKMLNAADLAALADAVLAAWVADGAAAAQKGALVFAVVHSGDEQIRALRRSIDEWAGAGRQKLAGEAIKALALNGGALALMYVDAVATKYRYASVRKAASLAFGEAAAALGVPVEALGDKVVPTLGFDDSGRQQIDFGTRQFTAAVTPGLELTLADADGNELKKLPKPGKDDDSERAKQATKEFALLKKQLKTLASMQKIRLGVALSAGRSWLPEDWQEVFLQNPLLNRLTVPLVWSVYGSQNELLQNVQHNGKGGFATADGTPYELPEVAAIRLAHPLELGKKEVATWQGLLAQQGSGQPIDQLARRVFAVEEKPQDPVADKRFGKMKVDAEVLAHSLMGMGWDRGNIFDGAGYSSFVKQASGMPPAIIHFSGTAVGVEKGQTVELDSLQMLTKNREFAIELKDTPPRWFSDMCWEVSKAAEAAKAED